MNWFLCHCTIVGQCCQAFGVRNCVQFLNGVLFCCIEQILPFVFVQYYLMIDVHNYIIWKCTKISMVIVPISQKPLKNKRECGLIVYIYS